MGTHALVVKWISRLASNQLLGVRIPPRAPYENDPKGSFSYGAREQDAAASCGRDSNAAAMPPPGGQRGGAQTNFCNGKSLVEGESTPISP